MGRYRRIVLLVVLGLLTVRSLKTQTFSEWFRQNSTRLKYYGKQIAALQLYLGKLEKGYEIANDGIGSIGNANRVS
jgi:hypothetical protein